MKRAQRLATVSTSLDWLIADGTTSRVWVILNCLESCHLYETRNIRYVPLVARSLDAYSIPRSTAIQVTINILSCNIP